MDGIKKNLQANRLCCGMSVSVYMCVREYVKINVFFFAVVLRLKLSEFRASTYG